MEQLDLEHYFRTELLRLKKNGCISEQAYENFSACISLIHLVTSKNTFVAGWYLNGKIFDGYKVSEKSPDKLNIGEKV